MITVYIPLLGYNLSPLAVHTTVKYREQAEIKLIYLLFTLRAFHNTISSLLFSYLSICCCCYCCASCVFPGEPDLDIQLATGSSNMFHSFFTRAYHARMSQHSTSDPDPHMSLGRSLPQHHPLLTRHADHPQQIASRATGGTAIADQDHSAHARPQAGIAASWNRSASGGHIVSVANTGGGVVDPHQHESALQQLLSDISAASGTTEVLGFGMSSSTGTQRNRGTYDSADSNANTI